MVAVFIAFAVLLMQKAPIHCQLQKMREISSDIKIPDFTLFIFFWWNIK